MKEAILAVLRKDYPEAEADTKFEDLRMDSLDLLDFIGRIEETFDRSISPAQASMFQTVNDVAEWVERG
jgi:acyl carrier protein